MSTYLSLLANLGITENDLARIALPRFEETSELILADIGPDDKEKLLIPKATKSWKALKSKAISDGITLFLYSAYRSYEFQFELIQERMRRGESLEKATQRLTPPGFSEHHTGRAVDITTRSHPHPSQGFDQSVEFHWLTENAEKFSFFMSYPKNNTTGIMYEPWHWCYKL